VGIKTPARRLISVWWRNTVYLFGISPSTAPGRDYRKDRESEQASNWICISFTRNQPIIIVIGRTFFSVMEDKLAAVQR
jgi:hypothetical protein